MPKNFVTICVLIPENRDRQLKELAKRAGMSVSDLVRDALKMVYGAVEPTSEVGHGQQ